MTDFGFTPTEKIVRKYRATWLNLEPTTRGNIRILIAGQCAKELRKAGVEAEEAQRLALEVTCD
jgi:hypothetical protein